MTGETGPDADGGVGGQKTAFGHDKHLQSHYTEGLFGTNLFEKWYHILQGTQTNQMVRSMFQYCKVKENRAFFQVLIRAQSLNVARMVHFHAIVQQHIQRNRSTSMCNRL